MSTTFDPARHLEDMITGQAPYTGAIRLDTPLRAIAYAISKGSVEEKVTFALCVAFVLMLWGTAIYVAWLMSPVHAVAVFALWIGITGVASAYLTAQWEYETIRRRCGLATTKQARQLWKWAVACYDVEDDGSGRPAALERFINTEIWLRASRVQWDTITGVRRDQ